MSAAAPPLPPGRHVDLPRRGPTFVRELAGPAGAPTVVLLHGWTATADLNWFRCYGALGRHFRVVAIDHRGHGRGIRSRRPFSLSDCADDVAAMAHAIGLERFIPVGYSMGGPIAQLLWKRHRRLVQGLVLCATSRNFGRSPQQRALFGSMLGLSAVARVTPARLRARAAERLIVGRVQGPLGEWVSDELRRNDPATVLNAGWSIGRFSSHDWIGQVDVPAAVVITTRDTVVPPLRQEKLAAAIPGATVHRVAADHAACVMRADLFVPALVDACRSVARRVTVR